MLRALAAIIALILALALPAWAQGFVPGTEDLPLMPGLAVQANSAVVFDKPQGRIVEAVARGRLQRAKVLQFYASTLPSLGWSREGEAWRRDGETLLIHIKGRDGDVTVAFSLKPREGGKS
jgi:hypothetical protein